MAQEREAVMRNNHLLPEDRWDPADRFYAECHLCGAEGDSRTGDTIWVDAKEVMPSDIAFGEVQVWICDECKES